MSETLRTGQIVAAPLERLLRAQLEVHDGLLAEVRAKRAAISAADLEAVHECCRQETLTAGRLETLEQQRRALMAELTRRLAGDDSPPLTVRELAERLDEPTSDRLLAAAAMLREKIEIVRQESTIVRTAADALARHLGGLVQTMQTALGRAALYGREGRLAGGTQLDFSVDLRT